jgi:hypothetical protein
MAITNRWKIQKQPSHCENLRTQSERWRARAHKTISQATDCEVTGPAILARCLHVADLARG